MGLCWSEPPVAPIQSRTVYVEKPQPSAPQYIPPASYNQTYTYAQQPHYQQYPIYQQYPTVYTQYTVPQQYQQPRQQQVSAGTAFVGGMILGSVLEDIMDPE